MATEQPEQTPTDASVITPGHLIEYKGMLEEQLRGIDEGIKKTSKSCALWTGDVVLVEHRRKLWNYIENLTRRKAKVVTKIKLIDEYTTNWVDGAASSFRPELIANDILLAGTPVEVEDE